MSKDKFVPMTHDLLCSMCGKRVDLNTDEFDWSYDAMAREFVIFHTECYRKELRHDKC